MGKETTNESKTRPIRVSTRPTRKHEMSRSAASMSLPSIGDPPIRQNQKRLASCLSHILQPSQYRTKRQIDKTDFAIQHQRLIRSRDDTLRGHEHLGHCDVCSKQVSFTNEMKVLNNAGNADLNACGNTISRMMVR